MKNIFTVILLIFIGCSSSTKIKNVPVYGIDNRWIDMDDILLLVKYSYNNDVGINEVLNLLGEPIYIEKYSISETYSTLLWYKYKSKFYPVIELVNDTSLTNNINSKMVPTQIKPEKLAKHKLWEESEIWLLIVINDKYHEIVFTTIKEEDPRYKRELIYESKMFDKNLVKDLPPESAKAILENN